MIYISLMEELKKIFYNPQTGYRNLNNLWTTTKENNLNLTFKQVKKFYNDQVVNQVYKESKPEYKPIVCSEGRGSCIQFDLMDISKYYHHNKPYKFLLNIIDVFSRYVWSYPIKGKDSKNIINLIESTVLEIRKNHKTSKISFTSDEGNEFVNKSMEELKNKYDFIYEHYTVKSNENNHPTQTGIIERFNRTLWNIIKKYTLTNNTLSFVKELPSFIKNYNNQIHRGIKSKPFEVFFENIMPDMSNKDIHNTLVIGDKVRIKNKVKTFDKKSFELKFSVQIYIIDGVENNRYSLMNSKNKNILNKKYLERELQKVDEESTYDPPKDDEIIDEKDLITYDEKVKENNKKTKFVRKQKQEPAFKGQAITDDGKVIINKHLVPKNEKRVSKKRIK